MTFNKLTLRRNLNHFDRPRVDFQMSLNIILTLSIIIEHFFSILGIVERDFAYAIDDLALINFRPVLHI